ncbi:MAG TPA: hypothetical protein VG125_13095 [Pirellulales bacterium]|jgi:hypothetical protein|nr:hypothetical protein [Pirellulales bacterium]
MKANQKHELRIQLDTKHCRLSAHDIEKMEANLGILRTRAGQFPIADLYVTVTRFLRSGDYHVKTSLVLTGRTLFTGDRDVLVHPAYLRCVHKLLSKLDAYIEALGNKPALGKHREGTRFDVVSTGVPDAAQIERAVEEGDYGAFRRALDAFEEAVRKRVSRWINRYPQLESRLGEGFTTDDAVEEVFLNAYERYQDRPQALRLGEWLEDLIDPSLRALIENPEEELASISLARTLREIDLGS